MSKYAFGIDLGTTNSCIAVKQDSHPAKMITLADGAVTLPSCVMYKDGQVVVGQKAYEHRFDTKHVVYSSKRDIGSDKKYTVYANGDDQPPIEVTPVDVAAEILKKLKTDAELLFGNGFIHDVTITVPAYFTFERRAATIAAAKQAGLNVISLINEPTAAALAYTEGKASAERILVYDLGGGTFDVTLLEMLASDNDISALFGDDLLNTQMAKVISSAGDPWLGGDDLDTLVYENALAELRKDLVAEGLLAKDVNIDGLISSEHRERAILTIEQAKKSNQQGSLNIPLDIRINGENVLRYIYVNSDSFAKAAGKLFARTLKSVQTCLEGRDINSISKLVLIGGSTKSPTIRELAAATFKNMQIYLELNPDEAVALGAAVNSAVLNGDSQLAITDVLPQSIGIKITSVVGSQQLPGRFLKLISRNTALPVTVTSVVTTTESGQTVARIPVFQGEDPIAENNTPIGDVCLELEPSQEIQDIQVKMTVDASGLLKVTVASASNVKCATIQNILNPAINKKSKLDKLITRYALILQDYEDTEYYTKGQQLINRVKNGESSFAELQEFFKTLPTKECTEADSLISPQTQFFGTVIEDEEDDSEETE